MFKAGDMKGRAALVTSAGRDLGRVTALHLAGMGADLLLVDEDSEALNAVAGEIRDSEGKTAVFTGDIGDPEKCAEAVAEAVGTFGRLDALCNVATVFIPSRTPNMPRTDWERSLAINLSAPFYLSQAAIPHLLETGGAIVNVASCVVSMAVPNTAAYAASKAGLVQMTKAMAREYRDEPIRINAIAPGTFPTDAQEKMTVPDDVDAAEFRRASPGRGMVAIEQVADLIAFLASPASEGYHGACITLDNGTSLG